jgi:hypothetical protein
MQTTIFILFSFTIHVVLCLRNKVLKLYKILMYKITLNNETNPIYLTKVIQHKDHITPICDCNSNELERLITFL